MSDKDKLNSELNSKMSSEHSAIERALLGVALPESALDHDSVMYRAGWAAAMAERDSVVPTVGKPKNSRLWPALAMTFAATTAACLIVIVAPFANNGEAVANNDSAQKETATKTTDDSSQDLQIVRDNGEAKTTPDQYPEKIITKSFGLPQLFGIDLEEMKAKRQVEFARHLAESESPSKISISSTIVDDSDFKPLRPLRPRSAFPFTL